jgi:hypothetical protein
MRDRMARHIETILSAAVDYCLADELDASARAQFEQLKTDHHGGDVCCVPAPRYGDESDAPDALPRSEWCQHCKVYERNATDASYAKLRRRSARQRMKRAYRKIIALRAPLADEVIGLTEHGIIGRTFTTREVAFHLKGVFSNTEIREGLRALTAAGSMARDLRFRSTCKYKYETVC